MRNEIKNFTREEKAHVWQYNQIIQYLPREGTVICYEFTSYLITHVLLKKLKFNFLC